jgi:hypothetical protein
MLRFLDRLDALSMNLIWNFETTSGKDHFPEKRPQSLIHSSF